MNRHRFDDVVTNDIMFKKVSQSPVFSTAGCALGTLSILYIIFINSNNNVIMSSAPVYGGFVGDVRVTLSPFVLFCVSRGHSRSVHYSHTSSTLYAGVQL